MSDTPNPIGQTDLLNDSSVCVEQKQRTRTVEHELKKLTNRMARDRIASVFHLQVYAFNCDGKKHDRKLAPDPFHCDYVAGGGRWDVPGALQATIHALEHALTELKKRVQ